MYTIINKKYYIESNIGSGSFGTVYKGANIRTNEKVAIKTEKVDEKYNLLKHEANIYQILKDCKNIPNIKWFGKENNMYYMVIDLYDNSLFDIVRAGGKLSLNNTLRIGLKILNILEFIHNNGLIHRDIKPDNFMFKNGNINDIYLIDLGFCKTYIQDDIHIPFKKTHGLIGSKNYASINSHLRNELSRRDDIESLFYLLIFMLNGKLKWGNITCEEKILYLKNTIIEDIIDKNIIFDLLLYIKNMKFDETPNYKLLYYKIERNLLN